MTEEQQKDFVHGCTQAGICPACLISGKDANTDALGCPICGWRFVDLDDFDSLDWRVAA